MEVSFIVKNPVVILLYWLMVLLIPSRQLYAQTQLYTDNSSFSYSESLPLQQMLNEKDAIYQYGNRAFTHTRLEAGVWLGNWKVGVFGRYDYGINLHPGSPLQQYAANGSIDQEQSFVVTDDYLLHTRAWGMKLGYSFQITPTLQLITDISFLMADEIQDGKASGWQGNNNSGDLFSEFDVDYYFDEDFINQREVNSGNGYGYGVDITINWQPLDWLRFDARLDDLYSRIHWDKVAYTQATITTNTIDFDDQGRIITQPALSGKEGYKQHIQALPIRVKSQLKLQLANWFFIHSGLYYEQEIYLPEVGLSLQWQHGRRLTLYYQFNSEAAGISLRSGDFELGVIADSLDTNTIRTFGANLSYQYRW